MLQCVEIEDGERFLLWLLTIHARNCQHIHKLMKAASMVMHMVVFSMIISVLDTNMEIFAILPQVSESKGYEEAKDLRIHAYLFDFIFFLL